MMKIIIISIVAVGLILGGLVWKLNVGHGESQFPRVTKLDDGQFRFDFRNQKPPAENMKKPLPQFQKPTEGLKTIKRGDIVKVSYQMNRWSTSEVVESTLNSSVEIMAGMSSAEQSDAWTQFMVSVVDVVPQYLSESIEGAMAGQCYQVIFGGDTTELPQYYKPGAYVLIVNIEEIFTPEEYAAVLAERASNKVANIR